MATHRVTSPEPGHSGEVGKVMFSAGVADADETQHAAELAYFRAAGYGVEPVEEAEEPKSTRRRGAKTEGEPAS